MGQRSYEVEGKAELEVMEHQRGVGEDGGLLNVYRQTDERGLKRV